MFKHNLLIIYRNFKRYKSSFFINLIGLSTGLACTLLIYLWVYDELTFDNFHQKNKQLYQVMGNDKLAEETTTLDKTPVFLGQTLLKELPEIKDAVSTSVLKDERFTFKSSTSQKKIKAAGQFVTKNFFNVFSYKLSQGDANTVLSDKNSVVISEKLARKLFNTTSDCIGKTLQWNIFNFDSRVTISGVFKDVPSNSSEQFDFLLSFDAWIALLGKNTHWGNWNAVTYVLINENSDISKINSKITQVVNEKRESANTSFFLKPYSERYLYGRYENGVLAGGRIEYVKLFSLIAFFILIIACINFMNLSTAKASGRMKEVGIKKAIGASRRALIIQYLFESVLMSFLSFLVAIFLVWLFLPAFSTLTGKALHIPFNTNIILSFIGITLFTGLLSGSYPALYLSGINIIKVLKGKLNNSLIEILARKGLVIFQFTLSVIFIVSVLVVYKQIEFIQSKNLGYNKDNIIHFQNEGEIVNNQEAFLNEIKNIPGVIKASGIGSIITGSSKWTTGDFDWEGKNPNDIFRFENIEVDYEMIELLNIQMKDGRTFSKSFGADSSKIILNEAAIKAMGIKNPVGKIFNLWGKEREIIGITKDFHFRSLHEKINPLFFQLVTKQIDNIMVKIEKGTEKETIARLQDVYQRFNPGFPFEYKFLDENYQALYEAENRVARLSEYFAGLAILISCLGLFGLAAFTAERRSKEIGIRKVIGASTAQIVNLLSGEFIKIVLIAVLIALPLSYAIMQKWLNGFAYRIGLEWWYFIVAGISALMIAWITVGMHAVKAARTNPVKSLRME